MVMIRRLQLASRLFILSAVGFLAFSAASAQPDGDEPEKIHRIVDGIQRQIAGIDRRISQTPGNTDLYASRGSYYFDLYRTLYDGSYLSNFYGEKPPGLQPGYIATRAIENFTKAIRSSPAPELYGKRGEMYAVRWYSIVSSMKWHDEIKKIGDPEWRDLLNWRTGEKEEVMFERLMGYEDFGAGIRDLIRGTTASADPKLSSEFHEWAAKLYLERSQQIARNLELNRRSVITGNNRFGYRILDDINKAIDHIEKSAGNEKFRLRDPNHFWPDYSWINTQKLSLPFVYYYKAHQAAGTPRIALEALNKAVKYTDLKEPYNYLICDLISERSRVNLKLGKWKEAVSDANFKPSPAGDICSYELRGDVYLAKGDFRSAIADFTHIIDTHRGDYDHPRIHKKRGIARMNLGEYEGAIEDLSYFILHATDRGESYGPGSETGYLLRARAYREIGDTVKATQDEKAAKARIHDTEIYARKRGVYGKVVFPDGSPANYRQFLVILKHTDAKRGELKTTPDEKGRFLFVRLEHRPFYIAVFSDIDEDGEPGRFYARTSVMNLDDKLTGPLLIKLSPSIRLDSKDAALALQP